MLLDLLNSSYPTQPHSLIAKYHLLVKNNKGEGKGGLKERGGLINFLPLKREGLLETIKGLIWEVGGGRGLIITVFIYTQLKVQQSSFCGGAKTKNIIKIVKAINNTIYNKIQGFKIFT